MTRARWLAWTGFGPIACRWSPEHAGAQTRSTGVQTPAATPETGSGPACGDRACCWRRCPRRRVALIPAGPWVLGRAQRAPPRSRPGCSTAGHSVVPRRRAADYAAARLLEPLQSGSLSTRTAACNLKPSISAHSSCRSGSSRSACRRVCSIPMMSTLQCR